MSKPNVYTVGGTVQAGSGLYIPRAADGELLELCRAGTFAYVLTARQMGKSSLMVRTAERLAAEGVTSIIIDLSAIGANVRQEEWYFGILTEIVDDIELDFDIAAWWKSNAHLSVTHRMVRFYERILLKQVAGRVVIFIDEIDTTLSLDFTDDFYAAIRSIYNARADNADFRRLSFVLIGVATPSDLMTDPNRTPFNIGERVELTDFTFDEAAPLGEGLGLGGAEVKRLLGWVMNWTGGHPYLSQRLCQEIARQGRASWSETEVDGVVSDTFLGDQGEQDKNLQFVRDMLTKRAPNAADVLATYQEIRLGSKPVIDEKQSLTKNHLKLSGVVRRDGAVLVVRNLIYKTIFNIPWVQSQTSGAAATTEEEAAAPPKAGDRLKVFVGSTLRDLAAHRREVIDACLRQAMTPTVMEHLPSDDAEAIQTALALVDHCDIYIGVFGHRYGYVPASYDTSITEMEYERATRRGIPRLIFLMHEDHPVRASDVETGAGADKLKRLKERLKQEVVVNFFRSPEDLRAHVINSLALYRTQHDKRDMPALHYASDIPAPPEAFVAHPYTLSQTHRLVGRAPELALLTDWVAKPGSEVYDAHVLSVAAIGGLGKSALAWKWFNDIAPQKMMPLAGRMWWSFHESGETFENFVARALAYVSRRPLEEVQQIPAPERETQLLAALDHEPFLVVLDGFERMLVAYAREDAARLEDSQVGNQRSLRKTADTRAGRFLKKLAQVRSSRTLISTRLHPADLETEGGDPMPGSFRLDLTGLTDDAAVELWRALNVSGARDLLLPVFATFGRHPLLIQALAGEVKRFRPAPGDFEAWLKANPRFDPTKFNFLNDAMSHVLQFALHRLDERARAVLEVIAAFRLPANYDTLTALLLGKSRPRRDAKRRKPPAKENGLFGEETELDAALTELEDRGLIGWDKRANRYDIHPVVRGVVWGGLSEYSRRKLYTSLHDYFASLPSPAEGDARDLEDLAPAVELHNALIGLGRYHDALMLFRERIDMTLSYRLSANRRRAELLEMFFPDGLDQPPRLGDPGAQAFALNALASAYQFSGQPRRAAPLLERSNAIAAELNNKVWLAFSLLNLSYALRLSGALRRSEGARRRVLLIARERKDRSQEAASLNLAGWVMAARGSMDESQRALRRALRIDARLSAKQAEGVDNSFLAQSALWLGRFAEALSFAERAWELANVQRSERDFIRAARVWGEALLGRNDFAMADERLHYALTRARMADFAEEELPALVALAELRRQQGELGAARELLEDVWEAAERGPYPLVHADACCVLAEIERDEGNSERAVEAARKAYELAWCDGPPFAYHWGLERARALLKELGAGEPVLPAFDESKFEPMPEVEIDPADEFGVVSVGESKVEG